MVKKLEFPASAKAKTYKTTINLKMHQNIFTSRITKWNNLENDQPQIGLIDLEVLPEAPLYFNLPQMGR